MRGTESPRVVLVPLEPIAIPKLGFPPNIILPGTSSLWTVGIR